MNDNLLEIHEYLGEGFKPLIDFNCWRVAVLRYLDDLQPDRISYFERHNETDEVFVLLQGQAILFIGEGDETVENVFPQVLLQGVLHNVKRGVWHTAVLSRDATILLVENRDTTNENTRYFTLLPEHSRFIVEKSASEIPDWRILRNQV